MENVKEQSEKEGERLPYEKPSVVAEEVFETMALSCAREGGTPACEFPSTNS